MAKLYIIIAMLGWAFWAFAAKIVAEKLSPLAMQISSYSIGLLCLPFFIAAFIANKSYTNNLNGWIFAISGGAAGVVAYLAYTYALKTYSVGTVSVITSCYPLLTMIAAMIFLGEPITIYKILGATSILTGMVLLTF